MSIRFNVNRNARSHTTYLSFTFLASPLAVQEQMQIMADRIQQELRARYPSNTLAMTVEFFPENGVANVINARHRIDSITNNYLFSTYEAIVQSQETVQLENLRIRIKVIGQAMRRKRGRGRGRQAIVPDKYKGHGIYMRPWDRDGKAPCLTRALLQALVPDLRGEPAFGTLEARAYAMARLLELPEGETEMTNDYLDKFVTQPGFDLYRVVVFSELWNVEYQATGARWEQPEQRHTPDDKTIFLLNGDNHYYWIKYPKQTSKYKSSGANKVVRCYQCLNSYAEHVFDTHTCDLLEKETYVCAKCDKQCANEGSLKRHQLLKTDYVENAKKNDLEDECVGCPKKRKDFYSFTCFEYHQSWCNTDHGITCDECGRQYTATHACNDWGHCSNCDEQFMSQEIRASHRCYFQQKTGNKYY